MYPWRKDFLNNIEVKLLLNIHLMQGFLKQIRHYNGEKL